MLQGDRALDVATAELVLEGLAAHRRISRADTGTYSRARPERPKGKGHGGGGFGGLGSDIFG
jgi:magnesium chelatase subunit I